MERSKKEHPAEKKYKLFMLTKLLFSISLLLYLNAKGQCVENEKIDTLIFNSKSSKQIDTIHFTAVFKSVGKNPHLTIVKSLIKQRKIASGDYSTSLEFIPTGGNKAIYLPFRNADTLVIKELVKKQNSGLRICVQAIIFKEYKKVGNDFFFHNRESEILITFSPAVVGQANNNFNNGYSFILFSP